MIEDVVDCFYRSVESYSEFALIVAVAATEIGLLQPSMAVMLTLLIALSYALNAPLNHVADALWLRYEEQFTRFERNVEHPDHQPHTIGKSNFLVVGMGRAGTAAYDRLVAAEERPLGIDSDLIQVTEHLNTGRRVIFGDARDPELWAGIELDEVEGIILVIPNLEAKISAVEVLRAHGFSGSINALIRQPASEDLLVEAGVTSVALPITQAGRELADVSLQKRGERWVSTKEPVATNS